MTMQARDLKPGDVVEIVMNVTVTEAAHYDDAGSGDQGIGFTSIGFNRFDLSRPLGSGSTTSYFTLELPDNVEHTITPV